MKCNRLYIIIFIVVIFASCVKDVNSTVTKDLVGIWISDDRNMQFSINPLGYSGQNVKYFEYETDNKRYLKTVFSESITVYQIQYVNETDMSLIDDKSTVIHFNKIK